MTIWYSLHSFGTFSPVLVSCTKKNLATLQITLLTNQTEKLEMKLFRLIVKANQKSNDDCEHATSHT
jgi:hypothetical protein